MAENNNIDLSGNIAGDDPSNGPRPNPHANYASSDEGVKSIAASDQMRDFLNMDGKPESKPATTLSPEIIDHAGDLPPDLPFMQHLEEPIQDEIEEYLQPASKSAHSTAGPLDQLIGPASQKGSEAYAFVLWVAKGVLPYVVIFAIGLGLYFFYFSDFSISSIFKSDQLTIENVTSDKSNKDLEKLKKDQQGAYLAWMKQFFFAVNDEAIISMDTDVSGNGLTNFEKYLLNLNPKVYSTRGTNDGDGQLVLENISPWTGKPFTDQQKELVDKYINKELVNNRITAAALSRGVTKFAQYVSQDSPYYIDPTTLQEVNQNPSTATSSEVASNQTAYQAAQQAGSTGGNQGSNSGSNVGTNSGSNNNLSQSTNINLSIPGKLDISANNITVPLTWTKDVKDFDKDLKKGLVHYPGTVLPGEIGTSYISGHSSGYIWDNSPYKQIFAKLGQVKDGTSFTITVTENSGQLVIYHYVVQGRGEYAPNDQAQFVNTADSVVALSTCWPVGTTARRLVLFGKLSQTERQ